MNVKNACIGVIGMVLFLGLCALMFYFAFYESKDYYTIIDNSNVQKIDDVDFKYKYTLTSYSSDGKEKDISFLTTRELRSDAYIKIKYMISRGVVSWEEVQFDDIPSKAKNKLESK